MSHHCHAIACKVPTAREMFMCKKHWYLLPERMRRAIWTNYRGGQCDDMSPSVAYCEAAYDAVRYIAEDELRTITGNEPELRLYVQLSKGFGLV